MRLEIPTSETITLDRNHPVFEGTNFAAVDFTMELQRLYEADVDAAIQAHKSVKDARVVINEPAAFIDLFDKCVVSWETVNDLKGKPIPCTSQAKREIAKFHGALRSLVVMAARHVSVFPDVEEAEEKN